MIIDYEKLITAVKYVSRMSRMSIREFAQKKAHVYNDIVYFLRKKQKSNSSLTIEQLNKILKGYGLVESSFVYLDKTNSRCCSKFQPNTDLTLEMLTTLQSTALQVATSKDDLFRFIPKFNKALLTFNDYMNFLRGIVLYTRRRYRKATIEFYSTFSAKNKQECTIFITLNKNKVIYLIFRFNKQVPMVCLDMQTQVQQPLTLLDKAFKKCNYTNFSAILRFIDREYYLNYSNHEQQK